MTRPPLGPAPSCAANRCRTVNAPDLEILNATPRLESPPRLVVPYKSPAASKRSPGCGTAPSVTPVNECRTVNWRCLSSLNTVPQLGSAERRSGQVCSPPDLAIPYKFPPASCTSCPNGRLPSAPPVNSYSMWSFPAVSRRYMVPQPVGQLPWPPANVAPKMLPDLSSSRPPAGTAGERFGLS